MILYNCVCPDFAGPVDQYILGLSCWLDLRRRERERERERERVLQLFIQATDPAMKMSLPTPPPCLRLCLTHRVTVVHG
jgi:hypothetical protein